MPPRHLLLSLYALAFTPWAAGAIIDNFNDGNDDGWTRQKPLEEIGGSTTFSFPNGGYRITSAPSPDPGTFGPARAGSFRLDESFSNFTASIDLIDLTLAPASTDMGLFGRIQNPGLGSTDGYALTYNASSHQLSLNRIDDEVDTLLASFSITFDPAKRYRLILIATGTHLTATAADAAQPDTVLATLAADDATYASGGTGLLVYDDSAFGDQSASGTFDNFSVSVPEPSSALLLLAGLAVLGRRRRSAAKVL